MSGSQNLESIYKAELNTTEFTRLSSFIMKEYGIKMPPEKKIMLQSRLQKRLKALNLDNFRDYLEYVFSPAGQIEEVIHMMDVVSTNKTDFYREPAHFDFLLNDGLPILSDQISTKNINIWSAGCSSGEEAFTIAITLYEFKEKNPGINFSITATDISTQMLNKAVSGIYSDEKIIDLPLSIKKKYFLKSKNRELKLVKINHVLRQKIKFYRQNLLFLPNVLQPEYEIIFCRNVLIYFDRNTQFNILTNLCNNLKPGGFLFLGHSESITGFELPVTHIQPTIFRKK